MYWSGSGSKAAVDVVDNSSRILIKSSDNFIGECWM